MQKHAGRNTQEVLKVAVRMALIGKPNAVGNLGHGQRTRLQQCPGPLDPAANEVLVRGQASHGLKAGWSFVCTLLSGSWQIQLLVVNGQAPVPFCRRS